MNDIDLTKNESHIFSISGTIMLSQHTSTSLNIDTAYISENIEVETAIGKLTIEEVCVQGLRVVTNLESDVKIIPNPASNGALFRYKDVFEHTATIKIYNLHCEIIFSAKSESSPENGFIESKIDLDSIPSGCYTLLVSDGRHYFRKTLVINK